MQGNNISELLGHSGKAASQEKNALSILDADKCGAASKENRQPQKPTGTAWRCLDYPGHGGRWWVQT